MALVAAFALCAAAAWTITSLNHSYDDAVELARLNDLSDRVVYLDGALSSSARLAAATGDAEWRERYEADSRAMAAVWPSFVRALRDCDLGLSASDEIAADTTMTAIERDALALSTSGRGSEASALLAGARYRATKDTFSRSIHRIADAVDARVRRDQLAARRRGALLISICIVLLPLFAVCWIFALTALRTYIRDRDEAERSLREREERFALAAKATNDVMYDWDLLTNDVHFNEALKTQLGYENWESVEISVWADNIHPDESARVLGEVHDFVEGRGQSWAGEYRFRRGDGTYAHILDRGYLVRDAAGKPTRMIGAMLDMTALKTKEAEMLRLKENSDLILNAAADGIVGLDRDGRTTFRNAAAAEILGFPPEELGDQTFHERAHHTKPDGTPRTVEECAILRAIGNGESVTISDDVFWRNDGTSFSVEYSATPMRDYAGAIVGAVITFRDTTEARAVQRMKDEFVSIVSHELRTPLTSIRGALGLLAGGLLTKSPEKGQRMLDIAVANTDRLVRLINDILDLERIDSGKVVLTKTRCDAAMLLQSAVELLRPLADKAGITLAVGRVDATTLWADSDRIIQTLTNLVSNAIKFSPAGSTVTLSATYEREGVVFHVGDRGRGIPADKLESVFDRFQQVDASDSREKGGSGLGLAICRSIVRQHGGELRVESVLGEGSTFSFSLPAARAEAPARAAKGSTRVVVCDDDPSVREVLEAMLRDHGYDVVAVSGGEQLLRVVPTFEPDVILLDVFMPEMSGWEALARLKTDELTASIPVVILSVLRADEAEAPFDLAGWVSKPLDPSTLFTTLENVLGVAGRRPRIMLVEDDFDLAGVITASFERHGIETLHAATGREAIEMTTHHAPDLLILDLVLPELDGFGVVEWLRDNEQLRNVPLVVYSALDPSAAERQRLILGPTQFLTKSRVPPDEFERRVVALLDSMTKNPREVANVA